MVLEIKEDELGGHVSGMGEMMNACKLKTWIEGTSWKARRGNPPNKNYNYSQAPNINMNIKEIRSEGVDRKWLQNCSMRFGAPCLH
jgi:hypothetical protein